MAKQLNVNLAFTADTSKAKAQLQDLQNQLSQVINMPTAGLGEKMTTEINQAAHAAAELKVHLQNATNVKTGNLDFTKLNQSIKNSGSSLTEYAKKIQSIGPEGQKAFMLLAQSVASAEVPIRRSNALLTELWTTMKNTARWQLTSSMLHGFMGAVQSAVGYAEDLNESLNNIRIVTGNSVDQMADFAKEANKAAKSLSTSTTNYTNAALIYYQQGLKEQEVLERADITTKMANVSRQSAEEVSDQLTAIWNNFYDGSQSLEHYADAMTRLGADTASSSDEIAQGLEKFAAIGDMIGLSFDNAAAALATVTATTRQSADVVGTAFKTIFARIQGLSLGETLEDGTNLNKYSEALNKVGISIFEQNGELKDMDNILDEMGAKWKTMSKDQQVALAQTVAGVRQYNQLVALMDNYDFYEQNLFSAQTADGSLQKQADIYAESWEAASERVDAALEGLYDSLIDDEAFIDLLNGIEKIVSATEMMVDSMGGFGGVISGLGVIFTNVFRKQITQSITDASYSLMSWTESGRQKIQKEKLDQFSQMLQKAKIGETERAVLQAQFESYQQLTEKAKDLTDLERETYQILLDQQKARGKLAIQKKEEADKAKTQAGDARVEAKWGIRADYGDQIVLKEDQGAVSASGAITVYENAIREMAKARTNYLKARNNNADNIDELENKYFEANNRVKGLEEALKEAKEGLLKYKQALEEEIRTEQEAEDVLNEVTGKRKENDQVIREHTPHIEEESNEINNNTNEQNLNADSTERNAGAHSDLGEAAEEAAEAIEEENDKLNSSDIARNFVAGANAAMSAVSAVQAFSSIIDTINSDAEPMEKLTSVLMSVPMGATMAGNALNSLNGIMVKGDTSLGKMAASSGGLGKALGKLGGGADKTAGQLWALGGYALIAAAAIAAIVAVVKISIDVYNEDANAAKRASEAADNLSNSAKNAQDSVNNLLSTFDSYDSAIDKLEECAEKLDGTTESTENWQNALNDVNDQIWNILEKYPELAKMPNIFKNDGTLNRDVVDSYIAQQKNKADNARASALSAKARASQLQVKSDATNLRRGMSNAIANNTYDANDNGPIYTKNQAQASEMFNGLYELAKQENFNAEEFNTAVDDYIAGFEITSESFEDELRDAANDIRDLGKAAQAADTQMENVGKLLAKQVLGANATEEQVNSYSSNYSEAEEKAYDEAIKATKNGINIWSGKDDAELQALWDRYSKATGTNYQLSSNAVQGDDLNRSFEYINEEGIKVVISAEELAAAIASSEAQTQAQTSSREELFKYDSEKADLAFLNGEINEAVDTSLLNDLAQIMDLSDAATRQAIDAQLNIGQTAAEQTKIIEDMLSKMTAEEQELAEIAQLKADAAENYDLDADVIEIQAKAFQKLYEAEGLTAKQATQLAIENQRMNNGVADLVKNWKDWNKELKAGKLDPNKKATSDYAKVIKDLTKTIADLTGASADLELPDEFFDEGEGNLELLEKAAKGSEQAINELGIAVAKAQLDQFEIEELKLDGEIINQEAINNFTTNKEIIKQGLTEIQEAIQSGQDLTGQGLNEILANSTVGSKSWITALNEMAVATKMTTEEMNSLLNSMGLEADVKLEEKTVTSKKPVTKTQIVNRKPIYGETSTGVEYLLGEEYETVTSTSRYEDVTETLMIPQINVNGGNDNQSSVTFIGNGSVSPTSTSSKGGGGGGKKSSTKKKSDEIERYHTVNKEIESIESKMSRASSAKDNAFGKDKIPFINKEIDALNELINKHQEYKAEIEQNLKIDEANISQYGFIDANADGILDNWEAVMERELEAFNKAAQAYDKGGSEAAFEAATKRYEDFKAFVEQYEETQKLMEDALAKEEELEREHISKQLEKITAEVEFEIEINQRDLDKLDYIVDKLGRNLHTAIEQIDALGQQVGKYDNQSQFYRQGIEDIKATAATEGRALTDEEQRKIWEYEDALLDINGALLDIVETVEAKILEEFDEFNSKIDDNISRFDTYNSMLDHYNNIIKLSGRQTKDSMLMMELSAQKTETSLQKLNATRDKYLAQKSVQDDVASKLAEAQKSGNEADIKYWQEQYDEITKTVEESHDEMLASWEETLEAAGSQFDLAIETTIQTLKDSISEFGLDNLADRYSKGQEEQERYLSNLDKEYELNKLNREISGKIDDTDNIRAKQKLLELQDEINKKLASGEEMSRYDLEHLQKKYELELAKIALEEAQNAKSTVRLTKDSEGNFGYVYTADQDSIDNAQQNYEDKLYELKKSSEDYLDEMSEKIIQNQQEMMEALAEVDRTKFETQEEYEAELDRIKEYYMGRDKYYRGEMQKAMDELGVTYQETLLGQLEGSASLEEAQSKLETNTNETVSKMGEAWKEWHDTVGNAMEEAGTSSETFTEDIKSDAEEIGTATEDLANVIDEQTENMVDYMGRLVEAVVDWRDQYISAIDEIIKKNEELANVQTASFDMDTDYSALINEYLNNGGEVGDATYNELLRQRGAKVQALKDSGLYDEKLHGNKTDEEINAMYTILQNGGGTEEEKAWFTKDYIPDEQLTEIFNKLEVPLGALEKTVGDINTSTQEIKTSTDTVGSKIDLTKDALNTANTAVNTKITETGKIISDKLGITETTLKTAIEETDKSLNTILGEIKIAVEAVGTNTETLSNDINNAANTIVSGVGGVIDDIQSSVDGLERRVSNIERSNPEGFDTGGYTGSWGPEGKMAVLHEKELVLNKNDTSNLLNTLGVMKDIMHMIDVQANMASLSHLNAVSDIKSLNDTLEQNVTIHAEFPNATNRNEIEEAFSNLVNRATQYANRKK